MYDASQSGKSTSGTVRLMLVLTGKQLGQLTKRTKRLHVRTKHITSLNAQPQAHIHLVLVAITIGSTPHMPQDNTVGTPQGHATPRHAPHNSPPSPRQPPFTENRSDTLPSDKGSYLSLTDPTA